VDAVPNSHGPINIYFTGVMFNVTELVSRRLIVRVPAEKIEK
jgi:hypothetical protein